MRLPVVFSVLISGTTVVFSTGKQGKFPHLDDAEVATLLEGFSPQGGLWAGRGVWGSGNYWSNGSFVWLGTADILRNYCLEREHCQTASEPCRDRSESFLPTGGYGL